MPCYDGREEQDKENERHRWDALTAILYGVLAGRENALLYAQEWAGHHAMIDQYREAADGDVVKEYIGPIYEHKQGVNEVLDAAYLALCK